MTIRCKTWTMLLCCAAMGCGEADSELAWLTDTTPLKQLDSASLQRDELDAGDDAGVEIGPPSADAIRFSIEVPGSPEPVVADVTRQALGRITVRQYPRETRTPAKYGPLPVGFEGAFSREYCEQVRARVQVAASNSPASGRARQQVRSSGAVPLLLQASPFLGGKFTALAREAARRAGAKGSAFVIDNPLELTEVTLEVELADTALSRVLGGTDAIVSAQNDYLGTQLDLVRVGGQVNAALSAKDLLCDLTHGQATLWLRVKASTYTGRTRVEPFQPY